MDVLEKWGSGPIGIPHALKSHIIVPQQTSAVHSALALEFFTSKRLWQQDKWGIR